MFGLTTFLAGFYVRQIGEQLRMRGADVDGWLRRNGLRPGQVLYPDLQLDPTRLQALIRDALATGRDPALGLLVGARLPANAHGMLSFAALHSATRRQALEVLERFLPVRVSLLVLRHAEVGDSLRVIFEEAVPLGDIRQAVTEAIVLSGVRLFQAIDMGRSGLRRVALPFAAPDYLALSESLFGVPVHYGSDWAGFEFPLSDLDLPLDMADSAAFSEATRICQRELDKRHPGAIHATRVRQLLFEARAEFPSLSLTARMLCVTPRTLHRHLVQEGTSFKAILAEVRHALAREHLRARRLAIEEIAERLGYGDEANFRRAFKRWEGVAPSEYRRRQQGPA